MKNQELGHLLLVRNDARADLSLVEAAVDAAHVEGQLSRVVLMVLLKELKVLPINVDVLISLVQPPADLSIAVGVEQVDEPRLVIQNTGSIRWQNSLFKHLRVHPPQAQALGLAHVLLFLVLSSLFRECASFDNFV
uniref:Uncharacterized protein n=1 Tax=Strombidium inclinatum TaxID=197538 RepID=A0A7S3MVY4_9SPIT